MQKAKEVLKTKKICKMKHIATTLQVSKDFVEYFHFSFFLRGRLSGTAPFFQETLRLSSEFRSWKVNVHLAAEKGALTFSKRQNRCKW